MTLDAATLADLVDFARIELASHDLEPWAELLRQLHADGAVDDEGVLWLVKLYNAYDSLGSAWTAYRLWPSPQEWAVAHDGDKAAGFPIMQERRNLFGGRMLRHLDSYVAHLAGGPQRSWVELPLERDTPQRDFLRVMAHVRRVWGTGRQSAFEWAEFLGKVNGLPIHAGDAQLWESSGPRRSLERIYGNPHPDQAWLDAVAAECRDHLAANGVHLEWEDFETVICDFNVMRDGRYYPGRHLAALREEIDEVPESDRGALLEAWHKVIPAPWSETPPGIDRSLMPVYRDTGRIAVPAGWSA